MVQAILISPDWQGDESACYPVKEFSLLIQKAYMVSYLWEGRLNNSLRRKILRFLLRDLFLLLLLRFPCQISLGPANHQALISGTPPANRDPRPASLGLSPKKEKRGSLTLLNSANIFHTLASSNRAKLRPYSAKKCAKLPYSHSSVRMNNVSSCSQLSMYAKTLGCDDPAVVDRCCRISTSSRSRNLNS